MDLKIDNLPWRAEPQTENSRASYEIVGKNGQRVGLAHFNSHGTNGGWATAKLWGAAPELLTACESLLRALLSIKPADRDTLDDAIRLAEAAVVKAHTGEIS